MPLGNVDDGWVGYAACVDVPTHLFYPDKHHKAEAAKAVCARCPVREQCLNEAMSRRDPHGVWGGLSPEERKSLRRERNRGAAA